MLDTKCQNCSIIPFLAFGTSTRCCFVWLLCHCILWKGCCLCSVAHTHSLFIMVSVQVPCVQMLIAFVAFSSAAGSRSVIHSDSCDFKCKLLFAHFLSFAPVTLPLPLPHTDSKALAGELSDSYTHLQPQERNKPTKGDSKSHHGISRSAILCFYPCLVWRFWRNHSYLTAQLEGERRLGLKHHHSHNSDARALDGLHVVQHWDVQLHTQIFNPLSPCLYPSSTDHYGFVVHPLLFWDLHRHCWDEVYSPGRRQRHQKPHFVCRRSLFYPCRNIWFDTHSLVHQRDNFEFSGPNSPRKQQTWTRRSSLHWIYFSRTSAHCRCHLWHFLFRKTTKSMDLP